jgi:putative membrane protein insertion efficiency factor
MPAASRRNSANAPGLPERALCRAVDGYRLLAAPVKVLLGAQGGICRFTPSCSHYFQQAVCEHGAVHGSALGLRRIFRCHPWGGEGPDPVPRRLPLA